MISLDRLYEKSRRKFEELSQAMTSCEWKEHSHALDEHCPAMQEELARMKLVYFDSARMGTEVSSYVELPQGVSRYHQVNGVLQRKDEYNAIYNPIKECWRDLENRIFRETIKPLVLDSPIEDVFIAHLVYASMSYQWGVSVMQNDEQAAFEALFMASELLDKCLGMVWVKIEDDKIKKLSKTRRNAGKKGGAKKADVYKIIQKELVRLIHKNSPEDGWKNKNAVIEDVINPLWAFIEKNNFQGSHVSSEESLREIILRKWSVKVDDVKHAFNARVSKTNKTKMIE
ncbi:hypothetical protein P0C25_14300 [Citrobacter freundii]|uniref:hypothetical protein n=1 Tax=Citrobacter freundii TaxID=546 RepID=UPI0022ACC06E|nr:hypothetical protein [Citrobacter freundii]ELL8665355.1 hypothetical protein [Citrobacter freundii]MDE8819845.1 hypothetical protein [Citrobacter freundii]HCU2476119.1 hypothetical protein [Citrobacter freundii]